MGRQASDKIRKTKVCGLGNGVTLIFDKANVASSVLDVSVGFGAALESERKQGLAHFLEHTLFNGTKKHSKQEIFRIIDEVGGEINAFTLKESTRFYAFLLRKDFSRALGVLTDSLKNSLFDEKLLEIERKIILAELHQSIDAPDEFVFDMFLKNSLTKPFGRRTVGAEKTIKTIERKDLINAWKKEYFPKNLLVGVSGKFEEKKVMQEIEGAFSWNLGRGKSEKRFKESKARHTENFFERKTEHAHICLGFPVMNATNVESFLGFKLINAVLGGGLSSRLNEELREKRGLCYSVNSVLQAEEDYGFFVVYSSTPQKNLGKMKELILKELCKLKDGELSLKELNKAKNYILGKELILRENLFKRTEQNIQCWQYFGKTVKETFEFLEGITLDGVRKVAEKHIQTEKYGFTAIKAKGRV